MGLNFFRWNIQLVPQHFGEGAQLGDSFLPCPPTFLDVGIALHLGDENIMSTLIGDESALVDLSDDVWTAPNHPDTVEANCLDFGNVTATFVNCVNHFLLSLFSKLSIWVPAELKVWGNQYHI